MSDNIPFEIQEQIMKWLPVKPLLQFRSVSKAWKSTIDSSAFIHSYQHTQLRPHIVIRNYRDHNYVSVADDDTFPRQKVSLILPESHKQLSLPIWLGSSQGLFCLYGYFKEEEHTYDCFKIEKHTFSIPKMAVIWNPTIRKSVNIFLPDVLERKEKYDTFVGFGVCPCSLDPILVSVTMEYSLEVDRSTTHITWLAEAYRLSSGTWKSLSINMLRSTIVLHHEDDYAAIDRYIYWGAFDTSVGSHMLLSFDMITEEFTEIHLPNDLACNLGMEVYICKLKESLAVLQVDREVDAPDYHVWMMENSDKKSFTKIYTIRSNTLVASVEGIFGSRKSGEPIIAMKNQSEEDYEGLEWEEDYELFQYEPNSGQVNHIGISAKGPSFCVSSYTETLLLLNYRHSVYSNANEENINVTNLELTN